MNNTITMRQLEWRDLYKLGKRDNANRWYPKDETVKRYIDANDYRSPSRAWPYSYAKPLLTKKFAKWATANAPEFAKRFKA